MSKNKVIVPSKIYVARSEYNLSVQGHMVRMPESDASNSEIKSFESRKRTADSNSPGKLPAIEIKNEPRSGFKIIGMSRRSRTQNVYWNIMHPEGFEFECTSDNMDSILQNCNIMCGGIQDEMFFTTNFKLVSTNMPEYRNLIKIKNEIKKVNMAELQPMTIISNLVYSKTDVDGELSDAYIPKYADLFIYVGKVYVQRLRNGKVTINVNDKVKSYSTMDIIPGSSVRHLIYNISNNRYSIENKSLITAFYEIPSNIDLGKYDKLKSTINIKDGLETLNCEFPRRVPSSFIDSSYMSPRKISCSLLPHDPRSASYEKITINPENIDLIYKTLITDENGDRYRIINFYRHPSELFRRYGSDFNVYILKLKPKDKDIVDISSYSTDDVNAISTIKSEELQRFKIEQIRYNVYTGK